MNLNKLKDLILEHRRVLQYMFVGGTGVIVDNSALYLLVEIGSFDVTFSKILSAELAIATNFLINDFWTFREHNSDSRLKRFLKSNAIRVMGIIIALLVLKILYEGFGVHLIIANSFGILVGFTSNYVLESLYTWKTHEKIE